MAKIAISYRRADTEAIVGRIRDHLAAHYGDHNVFMDIENIPFGVDFRKHIEKELANCQVLFAIVGNSWLGPTNDGHFRIAEETDFVRIEIETAAQGSSRWFRWPQQVDIAALSSTPPRLPVLFIPF